MRRIALVLLLSALMVSCGDDEPAGPPAPTTGSITVTTASTGDDLPANYTVVVDGGSSQIVAATGSVTFSDLSPTSHTVELTGVPTNCTVTSTNPVAVTVTAGASTPVAMTVECIALVGDLTVSTVTTGDDRDTDRYMISIDGGTPESMGINAERTFAGLAAGDHSVELSDVAENCTVDGANPRTVNVPAGGTPSTTFEVTCVALTGSIQVSTETNGEDLDQDGYTVTVDDDVSRALAANASTTFTSLDVGEHTVSLSGVANNCVVDGDNPRVVVATFGQFSMTTFSVTCSADTGDLEITAVTTGADLDSDGYTVRIDGTQTQSVDANGQVTFLGLATGDHELLVEGVAENCTLNGDNPRTFTVDFNQTTQETLSVACEALAGNLEVTTATTGQDIDPDGYTVRIDGTLAQSINVNGLVTFFDLRIGEHEALLDDVAANCVVGGANPRTVSIAEGATAQTTFNAECAPLDGSVAALQFDGSQQSTQTPDAPGLDLANTWTIELWVRPDDVDRINPRQDFVSKWGTGTEASYALWLRGGTVRLSTRQEPENTTIESSGTLSNGVWHHVAVTFDNSEVRLYIDGELDNWESGFNVPQNSATPLSLGRQDAPSFTCCHYDGTMDEVRIWNVVRTEDQIAVFKDFQVDPSSPGLVAYWRLDEGSGDVAVDVTGNGHDMQLGDTTGPDSGDPTWVTPGMP